jgi:hypothetical protein
MRLREPGNGFLEEWDMEMGQRYIPGAIFSSNIFGGGAAAGIPVGPLITLFIVLG